MNHALSPEYKAMHGLIDADEYLRLTDGIKNVRSAETRRKHSENKLAWWRERRKMKGGT
jgi:hypothetical protein